MSTHIVQIGKHKFVCGLFWQSLSRPRDLTREAIELAGRIGTDLMVVRKDLAVAQAGFAQSKDGARRGLFSLAAVVSKTLAVEGAYYDGHQQPVHNWLSAFKLPDGMWAYFAVRDANFLPNGDFVGTKEEVLDRLHGDYGLGGWNVVIGDKELEDQGFHNFCVKRIEELIPRSKSGQIKVHRWWALRPVHSSFSWKPYAVAGTVIALSAGAAYAYWLHYKKEQEELERQRAFEEARRKIAGQQAASAIPHPWPKQPLPQATTSACLDKFKLHSPGGWTLNEYVCYPSRISYAWSRGDSTIDYLLQHVPNAEVEIGGDKASYSEPLTIETGLDEELLTLNALLHPLHSKLQLLGIVLKVASPLPPPPPPAPPPGQKAQPVPPPDWKARPFFIESNHLPPTEIAALLAQPGVRLEKLSYKAGAWSIEGVIYAK